MHTHTHTYFVLSFPSTCGTASPSGPCPPSKSSSLPNLQIVSPDLLLSVSPSQAYLRFSLNKILYGAEVNLTPNLKTQGPGYPFQSGSSSLSCPAWQTLPVATLPPAKLSGFPPLRQSKRLSGGTESVTSSYREGIVWVLILLSNDCSERLLETLRSFL